ncbi:hypothetical protein ACVWZ3_007095 [Bradyrhizobium sp. i1.3.6]
MFNLSIILRLRMLRSARWLRVPLLPTTAADGCSTPSQWLGDEHIQRDYELLAQELRGSNPDLATRTRFVDPLIAFQLSHGADSDALRAFHRLVDDRNGNDIADFLFLPLVMPALRTAVAAATIGRCC